jgi:hypothetical protein
MRLSHSGFGMRHGFAPRQAAQNRMSIDLFLIAAFPTGLFGNHSRWPEMGWAKDVLFPNLLPQSCSDSRKPVLQPGFSRLRERLLGSRERALVA